MENYYFDKVVAKREALEDLFKLALVLIEIQRKATVFRAGIEVPDLLDCGICANLYEVTHLNVDQYRLFFSDKTFPIDPYRDPSTRDDQTTATWGDNPVGNLRMAMLARMIKDLTHYLQKEALCRLPQ